MSSVSAFRIRSVTVIAAAIALVSVLPPLPAKAATFSAQLVKGGLEFPAGFTVAPDGRFFYGERTNGQVRIFNPSTGTDTLFFQVPNFLPPAGNERGLLGIALHPQYPSRRLVYVYTTRTVNGAPRAQVLRITDSGGTGTNMQVQFNTFAANHHNGGRILFGPDGMLYVVSGDKQQAPLAQDTTSVAGKMLRMTPFGGVPSSNPFGNLVWAYGIRNSFGFDFDPQTGGLWESENGPACNDELNKIPKGRNMGWGPSQFCGDPPRAWMTNQDGPNIVFPKRIYNGPPEIPALTGMAFCAGCDLGAASEGTLFMGDFNQGMVRRIVLNSTRGGVSSQAVVYDHERPVLSMETGPNGTIYFSDIDFGSGLGGIYKLVFTP